MKNEMTDAIYGSLRDETWSALDQLETKVNGLYQNITELEVYLHGGLLGDLIFRMVCNGWTKKELLDLVNYEVDESLTSIDELDAKEMV